jgi:hypothetical protein
MKAIMILITLVSMSSISYASNLSKEYIILSRELVVSKNISNDFKQALISTEQGAKRQARQYVRDAQNGLHYTRDTGTYGVSQIITEGTLPDGSYYKLELTSTADENNVVSAKLRIATTSNDSDTIIALSKGISGRGTGLKLIGKDNNFLHFKDGTGVHEGYNAEGRVLSASVNKEDMDLITRKLVKLQSDIEDGTLGKKIQLSKKASRAAAAK